VDKMGNAAFVATKTSQYSREGEPSRLFHIVLEEKDKDNDTIVVDLEEWEIDEYCRWIAEDEEGGQENDGQEQEVKQVSSTRGARPKSSYKQGTKTTEFEMLNNLTLEAAASVSTVPALVDTSMNNANDGVATLAEAAAAGCNKCRKLLETGKKSFGPHVKNCPRNGLRKSGQKSSKGSNGSKSSNNTDSQTSNNAIGASSSRKSAGVKESRKSDKNSDNTQAQSNKKTTDSSSTDSSGFGEKLGSNDKRSKSTQYKDNTDIQSSKKTIDSSDSRGKILDNTDKFDKSVQCKGNAGAQRSRKKKNDSSRRDNIRENHEEKTNEDHARALASKPCPSFNDILKSALASYSSNTRKKNTNDPPPPVPPPFLSHEENCTIRTALAFVMAKAKNKEKSNNAQAMQTDGSDRKGHSPLVGGLLALPPRDCAPIGQMNLNASNAKIVLDREMKHVRDVMNLAVSALLPLYKSSTLKVKPYQRSSVDEQRQCAVYDYESAAKQSHLRGSQFELPSSERHLASLDGLCRHIVGRLSSILNDKALRQKLTDESSAMMTKDTSNNDDQVEFSTNAVNYVSQEEAEKDIVRDAVAQLQMDFIIDSLRHSSNPVQQIHHFLASCHVLHRLLLLDENCTSIGSDCVAMACTLLTDLYNGKCIGGTNDGGSSFEEHDDKEKHQVVPSRWSYSTSSYIANREERRMQTVHTISQQCYSNGPALTGMKRSAKQSQDESSSNQATQLPRLGDVLAVNLLRLLEGASAIRLHFHKRYEGQNSGFVASKVATSAAAAEVLQEIRSKTDDELLLPIHMNDAASVYYHESLKTQERRAGKVDHLRPGAKMMLRVHLFGLIQKLSLYEQG